jgi:serine O-acetyltransferase
MHLSLDIEELRAYTSAQLNNLFPDKHKIDLDDYKVQVDNAISRLDNCFSKITLKHYNNEGKTQLNHLYSDQYLMYVWFLANTIYQEKENANLSNKLYCLNKSLFAFDCMYNTQLPDIFIIFHGAGTMLGKAKYSDYFIALQGCTIGSHKGNYPILGRGVSLTAHSSIIGNCVIEDRVSVGSYSNVFETNIDADTVVYRNNDVAIKLNPNSNNYAQQFFNVDLKTI